MDGGSISPISIDPQEGRVIWEELDGELIAGSRVEQRYWDQELGPDMLWDPEARRLKIEINRKTQRIRFEDENEEGRTVIVIEPKDAPDTGPLKPQTNEFRL